MTKHNKGHFAQKHPGVTIDEGIAQEIRDQVLEGGLFCAIAFKIAGDLSVSPTDVGRNADLLELPILKCQLGLMGYTPQGRIVKPAESVAPDLEKAIQKELVNGRLSCAAAFTLAAKFKVPKMMISSACEKIGIKISSCQLGTF
ncbi:MAG TPA: hypothetical protein VJ624_00865 [Thermodesulfobacteriota bacterium]|nr:hypothetical protein [Thermodesulfobacteriota bacterium]